MPRAFQIDATRRRCVCDKEFRITDYPSGYFAFKKQVAPGSAINTCLECEVIILRNTIKSYLKGPVPFADKDIARQKKSVIRLQQDIHLLLTGKPANDEHRRNIQKMYR